MDLVFGSFVLVLGLFVGSFLNVCICRLPKEESVVFPSSHCPACKHRLSVLDLVPLVSYALLRGKCRYCGSPISARYPIVELLTSLLFLAVFLRFGTAADSIFYFIFVSVLIAVTFSDLETQTIHDSLSITGIAAGLLYGLYSGSLLYSFLGMITGAFVFVLIRMLGKAVYKKEAMGEGDIFLAAALGAFFGLKGLFISVFLSFLIGAVVSVALLGSGMKQKGDEIPFGPYMAVSAVIVMFWGDIFWRLYLGL